MSAESRRTLPAVIMPAISAVLFFGVLMGISMGLVTLNARLSPQIPWFPLPVILLLWTAALWAERRWQIGLAARPAMDTGRTVLLTVAVTVLGLAACVLQGAFHGYVRQPEAAPEGVPDLFAFVYVLVMSGVAAVLAELAFRGIMQSRWHRIFSPWTVIALVAVLNLASHRWSAALIQQSLAYLVALGGLAWLRWKTGSLWPPLIAHLVVNLLLALAHSRYGAFDHGSIPPAGLWAAGLVAVLCFGIAATLGSRQPPQIAELAATR